MNRSSVLAVVALALAGCGRHAGKPNPSPSSAASAPVLASAATREAPSAPIAEKPVTPAPVVAMACRAIAVHGNVTADGKPLADGSPLSNSPVLELSKDSSVAVKNATTARELVFSGPGQVLVCGRGEERFLLTAGGAQTTTGVGARPGAEVLVATPFGAVRYGDAKLDIRVDPRGLTVTAEAGDAWVTLPSDASEQKIQAGRTFKGLRPMPDVKGLVADCEARASMAESRARAVLMPVQGAAPLGVRASEHVRARKVARLSCAIAAAGVLTLKSGEEREDLGRRVAYADARWASVPPRVDKAQKVESR